MPQVSHTSQHRRGSRQPRLEHACPSAQPQCSPAPLQTCRVHTQSPIATLDPAAFLPRP